MILYAFKKDKIRVLDECIHKEEMPVGGIENYDEMPKS